ncbi:hypothetical protein DPMN_142893 [Dreissena polymorpha]|uniref:Uncharacterized protein n=1 Tax=Dreissena polymorpha TaxID=45954 RepID=A0A9D4GI42_DREPO|nr:hypothetical protein DPMN_142893 [Dreissena polymorpha]
MARFFTLPKTSPSYCDLDTRASDFNKERGHQVRFVKRDGNSVTFVGFGYCLSAGKEALDLPVYKGLHNGKLVTPPADASGTTSEEKVQNSKDQYTRSIG